MGKAITGNPSTLIEEILNRLVEPTLDINKEDGSLVAEIKDQDK